MVISARLKGAGGGCGWEGKVSKCVSVSGFGRNRRGCKCRAGVRAGRTGGTEGAANAGRGFGRDRKGGTEGLQMQGGGFGRDRRGCRCRAGVLGTSGARCAGKRCGGGAGDCEILWRDEAEGLGNLGRISAEMREILGAVVRKCGKLLCSSVSVRAVVTDFVRDGNDESAVGRRVAAGLGGLRRVLAC